MTTTAEFIKNAWKGETLEAMKNFIRIPSKSSAFEAILIFQLSEVTLVVPSFSTVISTNNQKLKDGVKDSAPGHLL